MDVFLISSPREMRDLGVVNIMMVWTYGHELGTVTTVRLPDSGVGRGGSVAAGTGPCHEAGSIKE